MKIKLIKKYLPGGKTDSNVPTKEQFLQNKINTIIQQSLDKSNNRTKPTVPMVPNSQTKQLWESINEEIQKEIDNLKKLILSTQNPYVPEIEFLINIKNQNIQNRINALEKWLPDKYSPLVSGPSCIYTATDNYGKKYRCASNSKLASTSPSKSGFTIIDNKDRQAGDIVQVLSPKGDQPWHALTYTGKDRNGNDKYNYSNGGDTEEDIKNGKSSKYWDKFPQQTLRFTGTHNDSIQWIDEYNKLYNTK